MEYMEYLSFTLFNFSVQYKSILKFKKCKLGMVIIFEGKNAIWGIRTYKVNIDHINVVLA